MHQEDAVTSEMGYRSTSKGDSGGPWWTKIDTINPIANVAEERHTIVGVTAQGDELMHKIHFNRGSPVTEEIVKWIKELSKN